MLFEPLYGCGVGIAVLALLPRLWRATASQRQAVLLVLVNALLVAALPLAIGRLLIPGAVGVALLLALPSPPVHLARTWRAWWIGSLATSATWALGRGSALTALASALALLAVGWFELRPARELGSRRE
jgi:hypothetical protein